MPKERLKYIRNKDKDSWNGVVRQILSDEDGSVSRELKSVLEDHWRWHFGEFETVNNLYQVDSQDIFVNTLARVYRAQAYNTSANLQSSIKEFRRLLEVEDGVRNKVERYTGESLVCSIHSWNVWNITELLDFRELVSTMEYVSNIDKLDKDVRRASSSQLFLALGVMFLRVCNYRLAEKFLERAESGLIKNSIWAPRVVSAQALLYWRLGNQKKARYYLDMAIEGISRHFGPLGWQLRIAETMFHLGAKDNAIGLTDAICKETVRKKENIYSFWALIYHREFSGKKFPLDEYKCLVSCEEYSEMKRASAYCITNNLVDYGN